MKKGKAYRYTGTAFDIVTAKDIQFDDGLIQATGDGFIVPENLVEAFEALPGLQHHLNGGGLKKAKEPIEYMSPLAAHMNLDELEDMAGKHGISEQRIRGALNSGKIAGAVKPEGSKTWSIPRNSGEAWVRETAAADKASSSGGGQQGAPANEIGTSDAGGGQGQGAGS